MNINVFECREGLTLMEFDGLKSRERKEKHVVAI
jgi:hypothetical protein